MSEEGIIIKKWNVYLAEPGMVRPVVREKGLA